MGDSEMKRRIDPDDPNSEIRLKSKNDVGWLGEGGVDLRLPGRLGATGAVQYHRFDTSFDSAIFDNPRYKVEYWSFLIGLNLRFAGPNN
jgi:outer membrane protein W